MRRFTASLFIVFLIGSSFLPGQASGASSSGGSSKDLWHSLAEIPAARGGVDAKPDVLPERFVALTLDKAGMASVLASAPMEFTRAALRAPLVLSLPTPSGDFARFAVQESPVVAPELAARYPQIKTYDGQGIDDPWATIRFDLGLTGFHAQVLSPHGAWYIDPYYHLDDSVYVSYFGRDLQAPRDPFIEPKIKGLAAPVAGAQSRTTGTQLRTYRLALAADGEYSAFHGGTTPLVHNAMVTAVNRVTGIYETELAIRLQLVANNDSLIYLDALTDPYTDDDPDELLSENQTNVDAVIGTANYDIGHVVTTGGGGLAGLAVVGKAGSKAWGETGSPSPTGDAFYVDYVAHEMGHQFGGNHTFNGINGACSGNAHSATAMEPGSGSSIQGYAGICRADDLQPNSDPYFHAVSFDEIVAYTTTPGSPGNLGAAATTNNFPTVAVTGGPFTIPMRTPFALSATGSDTNGDPLTFQWDEYDAGALRALTNPSKTTGALFRSFSPTTSSTRTFPRMASILSNNTNASTGSCSALPAGLDCWSEFLPTTARSMAFRVTARDNRVDGGGVNSANTTVTVAAAGPFLVTAPNTAMTLTGGSARTVTWDVAGTDAAPINTANVNIRLSTDGGNTFPTVLAANTPNDGTQPVTIPNTPTAQARVRVEAAGNIYFDVSDTNFTISAGLPPCTAAPFSDVAIDHPFCPEISWMKDAGISTGYDDGTYRPSADVTRMAMSAFMARLAGASLTACTSAPFSDVAIDHPFCSEISWMKDAGISTGFADGTYRPSVDVTRMAMSAFMYRVHWLLP
ncbi:MAG: reprolysin-like metallopeptidase [Mycobacterium sp.]